VLKPPRHRDSRRTGDFTRPAGFCFFVGSWRTWQQTGYSRYRCTGGSLDEVSVDACLRSSRLPLPRRPRPAGHSCAGDHARGRPHDGPGSAARVTSQSCGASSAGRAGPSRSRTCSATPGCRSYLRASGADTTDEPTCGYVEREREVRPEPDGWRRARVTANRGVQTVAGCSVRSWDGFPNGCNASVCHALEFDMIDAPNPRGARRRATGGRCAPWTLERAEERAEAWVLRDDERILGGARPA